MTFVGLFPRIGWSWPNLSSWKWLNVRGSSLWTIRYHNDKRQLLFLFLHFILLISWYLPLALTSRPHAYPSWIPFPLHLTQNKTARVLQIFNNFWKSICVFDSWERRGKVFLLSLFTHICGIQFLFQLSEIFRTCNMWIQMTNSNNSNFSCFFVSLILVGSQTLATCHPTSFLSIPGIIWSDNTRLLSMFYFPLFTQSHFIWLWLCSPDITAFTKFCPTFYSSWTIGAWEMLRLHGVLLWSGKIRFTPLSM